MKSFETKTLHCKAIEKKYKAQQIKAALTLATGALLGDVTQASEVEETVLDGWQFDSAFLLYSEIDRVSAGEYIISGTKQFSNDEIANLKITIDSLTGASANGAVAQAKVQTFTSPSGKKLYTADSGETPLDDTFKDTRVQLNGQWSQPLTDTLTGSAGGHFSKEYDYLSLGVNGNLAFDFNKNNSTLSVGLSHFQDTFSPEGGIPKPLETMLIGDVTSPDWEDEFAQTRIATSDNKSTTDIMLGFTQVINRRMVTAFNYSYSSVSGYLTDPFKIVSSLNSQGIAQTYIYEQRPDSRVKQSVFMQSKYHFDQSLFNSIVDISYRYMWDDWALKSHTIDTRFHLPLSAQSYLEPHVRLYQQTAVNFYKPYLLEGEDFGQYLSADYRIGDMNTYTLGIKYGTILKGGNHLSFRAEYYRQMPNSGVVELTHNLSESDVYPVISAIILQANYSF